jgi:MFS family permease
VTPIAASVVLAVVLFDATAVSVLIPSMRLDLGSSPSGGQWMLNAYLLALAAPLPVLARLALPRRPLIVVGALAMAAGAVVSALADSTSTVVVGQAVAGAGAAGLLASLDGALPARATLPVLALPVLALALGPAIGGVIGEQNWWHLFFWGGIPLAVVAAAAAALSPGAERRRRTDGLDRALALGAGLVALTILLVQSEPWGFGLSPIVQLIPVVVLLAIARQVGVAAVIWGAAAAIVASICFLGPEYFELAHQLVPSHSGLLLSALTAPAVVGGVLGWRLSVFVSRWMLGLAGALVAAAGLIAFGMVEVHSSYALMGLAMALTGGGVGLAAGANAAGSALAAVPPAAALGLAAAGAIFQHAQAQSRADGSDFAEALAQGVAVAGLSLLAFASAAAGAAWFEGRRATPASSEAHPAARS